MGCVVSPYTRLNVVGRHTVATVLWKYCAVVGGAAVDGEAVAAVAVATHSSPILTTTERHSSTQVSRDYDPREFGSS